MKAFGLGKTMTRQVEFLVGGSDTGTAGALGQNVLGIGDVEYDLGHGVIRLLRAHDCGHANLAYWTDASHASLLRIQSGTRGNPQTTGTVTINGQAVTATFDTGAPVSILSRGTAARIGIRTDGAGVVAAGYQGGFGSRMTQTWITPVADFKIGDEEIKNTHLRIGDLGGTSDMLIGADFFLSHRIYVANEIGRMFFSYNGGPVFNLTTDETAAVHAGASPVGPEPTDAEGFSRRGQALAARRDYTDALADLDRACTLAPKEARYFYERAMLHEGKKEPALARADLDHAIGLAADDVPARLARARARLRDGDKASARDDLAAASQAMPRQSDQRLELGDLEEAAGAIDAALADYDAWIDLHREDYRLPVALNDRCWARALANRELPKALSDCSRAVSATKHASYTLDSRGLVFLRMGDTQKAIADYDAALAASPKLASSLYGRGLARLRTGDKAGGQADIAAAEAADADEVSRLKSYGIVQ